eukprot:842947-Alexandrium_andersonii.AAC.1
MSSLVPSMSSARPGPHKKFTCICPCVRPLTQSMLEPVAVWCVRAPSASVIAHARVPTSARHRCLGHLRAWMCT